GCQPASSPLAIVRCGWFASGAGPVALPRILRRAATPPLIEHSSNTPENTAGHDCAPDPGADEIPGALPENFSIRKRLPPRPAIPCNRLTPALWDRMKPGS